MYSVDVSGKARFSVGPDETLLAAALRSGVNIGYSCRTGRCSSCKCKVIDGITAISSSEFSLTDTEKADGWILSCVRVAKTDIILEAGAISEVVLPKVLTIPCRINRLSRLAADVIQVFLRLPPAAKFDFIPGQYVEIIGPKGVRRSYSIANNYLATKEIELHIRMVEQGLMSKYWFDQAQINDLLRIHGPLGTFFLRNIASDINLIFLATGTGIAPVKSILEHMSTLPIDKYPQHIRVLWGGRKQQDLYFDIDTIPGDFKYTPVQSQPGSQWLGSIGYVQDVLLESKPNLGNTVVYACGSEAMISSAKSSLVNAGLPAANFNSDAFVCSAIN